MITLFKIGFLPIRIWDLLDILIVGYLIYIIYRLLKGSIAFNIFIGLMTLYMAWWLVDRLRMDLLANVLKQFVQVGVIVIVIIFQQEIRSFLLFLGKSTLTQRSNFLLRLFDRNVEQVKQDDPMIGILKDTLLKLSAQKTGALIVLVKEANFQGLLGAGAVLDANLSEALLLSIFNKNSPLHDGAVLIKEGKIKAAGCVLPVSENVNLPQTAGLRHRAALGITEQLEVAAWVVSEETGHISLAYDGELHFDIAPEDLEDQLKSHY
jgi:uncharacterized protein (TIGR00159 family)